MLEIETAAVDAVEVADLERLRSLMDDADGPIVVLTSDDGFPTVGDLAALDSDGGIVPVLDWAGVGGVPQTVEGCRAVLRFIADSFAPAAVNPVRTRIRDKTVPGLGALAAASRIEALDVVLEVPHATADAVERATEAISGRRLGSGAVDVDAVTVVRDGERWIPVDADKPIRLSNIDKPFFPGGITKGDLIEYYAGVADVLLPYLADRPISMSRYPDGIDGPTFYEKRAPGHQPDWMMTATVESESMGGEIDFLLAADRESLMWFANMGCIEVHPFHSRAGSLDHPDYAIFDLDPAEGSTWTQVVTAARMVRTTLDALGLVGYPKLSGSKGMHIYVPVEPGVHDHARIRRFVSAVGELMAKANPDDITVDWKIPNRKGMVFVDANRNTPGQTIASVYSVRPRPGAPISVPITWDEAGTMKNGDVTLANIGSRIGDVGDLFEPVIAGGQTLDAAEERLELD